MLKNGETQGEDADLSKYSSFFKNNMFFRKIIFLNFLGNFSEIFQIFENFPQIPYKYPTHKNIFIKFKYFYQNIYI